VKGEPRLKFELASGRLVRLISLHIADTCEGALTPLVTSSALNRDAYREFWRRHRRGTLLLPLPEMDPEPRELPRKTYVVELRSAPIDPDMDASTLRVVWCGPGHAGSTEKYVEATLREISWIDVALDIKY